MLPPPIETKSKSGIPLPKDGQSIPVRSLHEYPRRIGGRLAEKGKGVYNVVVIGGGTAGLVTAAGMAGLGGRVALVERRPNGANA